MSDKATIAHIKKRRAYYKAFDLPGWANPDLLKAMAVSAMAYARPRRSQLPVGCAFVDMKRNIWTGANVETLWQRSYHAEEAAIINAMSHDAGKIRAIVIAANRELFTPCGTCMDLVMEFSTPDAILMHYNPTTRTTAEFRLDELMPHYPTHT